ncbi:AAA family ATPase [Thalassotalea sp. M1531]|uniref:AAA family ATPase n=1 Tax=Thalassotalea algicola TaxID=2716224 RepID=A0A7Y0LCT7_9GAMM|nr:AAA family ATPase [Thalassotalea algicola]NMP32235.1 AAA family ATPase [Thalassotalea algicola]
MYTSFFGLNDVPFSIAPNPDYLFLGDRHKEALAHLTYGLGDTGGFVLLTGEVGTGKTTLSRRLLEQLPENTQVAFILNPTLSCLELLATICDELKVRYKKTGTTLKYLTDKIQQKLLSNQSNDINTLLIIDEAQHLQPEVLEQLRLLTNLETNTKKLLQVVLIGQPELQQLLQRRDLRQLAQRITARYHLLPLTRAEVAEYIKHRLTVADCHRPLFNDGAIALIHKISKGIPRLINLLCDRALATAYGRNDSIVTRKVVLIASQQALGSEYHLTPWWQNKKIIAVSVAANLIILLGAAYLLGSNYQVNESKIVSDKSEASEQLVVTTTNTELIAASPEHILKNNDLPSGNVIEPEVSHDKLAGNIESLEKSSPADARAQTRNVLSDPTTHSATKATLEIDTTPAIQAQQDQDIAFEVSQVDGVSDDLLAKFQQAIDETQDLPVSNALENEQQEIPSLLDMPSHIQNRVPALQFEVHIFATDGNGWVRVNGRERYEGDVLAGRVVLNKITPDTVILALDGEQFSLPALSSW